MPSSCLPDASRPALRLSPASRRGALASAAMPSPPRPVSASTVSLVPHLLTPRRRATDRTRSAPIAADTAAWPASRSRLPSPGPFLRPPGRLTRSRCSAAARQPGNWLFVALVTVILVAELVLRTVPALAAESEPNEDLTPDLKALIAKERIRQRTGPRGAESRDPRVGNDSQNCGSVDIGNSQEARSRSARERMNPREQTVIVTGPVVNAARCR